MEQSSPLLSTHQHCYVTFSSSTHSNLHPQAALSVEHSILLTRGRKKRLMSASGMFFAMSPVVDRWEWRDTKLVAMCLDGGLLNNVPSSLSPLSLPKVEEVGRVREGKR